ncbi:MAG: sigma-70 family RNA polymerase sigma factor [Planctomycetota bacterium]|nr:sigma-70 family RNA polymerase sigma factor [Planctomycetota bacterium]
MHHGVVQQEKLARLLGRYLESGDETAVEQLVEEVRPRLLTVARRIGSPQDAEDTVQTALIALIRKRELDAPVMPWLVTAVIRIAYRRKAAERRQVDLARRLAHGRDHPTPAAAAIGAERRELVRRDIARLPARYRDAIVLHYLEGLTALEIARLLGVPDATVRTRLRRGRQLLRGVLGPWIAYPLLAMPWFLTDSTYAACKTVLGGAMKLKTAAIVTAAIVTAGAGGLAVTASWRSAHERRAPDHREQAPDGGRAAHALAERAAHEVEHSVEKPPRVREPAGKAKIRVSPQAQELRDRIVRTGESVGGKTESEQLLALWRLGDDLGKSRDVVPTVLELLRVETDPEVLSWLAETIRGGDGALNHITDDEWIALMPVLLHGTPAARRRAVVGIHSSHMRAPPEEVKGALQRLLHAELDPDVLGCAVRGLLTYSETWTGVAEDVLAVYRRMPAGRRRREVAYVYQRLATLAMLHHHFEEARTEAERNDWAQAIEIKGEPLSSEDFRAVYTRTTEPGIRERLLQRTAPDDAGLMRELLATETDQALRAKIKSRLAAAER